VNGAEAKVDEGAVAVAEPSERAVQERPPPMPTTTTS
jgi:hypothetical protein